MIIPATLLQKRDLGLNEIVDIVEGITEKRAILQYEHHAMENNTIIWFEIQLNSFIESLSPPDKQVRKMLDFGFSWDGKSAFLFEIRPQWNDPSKLSQLNFAKLKYVKSKKTWELYWMRASGKWEAYSPHPTDSQLQNLLAEIKNDEMSCFFG